MPIEVVEYDDRSNSEEVVKALERLVTQDKVDFILPPWGTGLNLAVGPIFNKYGYPHLAVDAPSPTARPSWPSAGRTASGCSAPSRARPTRLVELLVKLRKRRQDRRPTIAMVAVADGFGIELSTAARAGLKKAGFKLVYDKTYPLGTQDLQPIVNEAQGAQPRRLRRLQLSAGHAWRSPSRRKIAGFNPKVFFIGVGTAFPLFKGSSAPTPRA